MIIPGRIAVLKRLPTRIDRSEGIQRFDVDNLYPQRAKETMYRSYTLTGIIEKLSGFLNGEGFEDVNLNTIVVSGDGIDEITLQELFYKVCFDYAWAKGFALHINYNLNYTISSITNVPFEYCRLGIQDDEGCVNEIAYSTNWERDFHKDNKLRKIIKYDRFNPDPEYLADRFEQYGVEGYKGQIFYYSADKDQYPKASFDSVFEHAQTQAEIALFMLNSTVNGFTAGHIFMYPGKFENKTEEQTFKDKLADHKGANGANSILVIETGTTSVKASDMIVKTELQNLDKMFEYTTGQIEKAMLQNYGMPYEIIGKVAESGLFTKQQIEDAYTYYNAVTRDSRTIISRVLSKVFKFWVTPIESDFKIMPQVYDKAGVMAQATPLPTNQTLTNLSGRQNQNFKRMLREYEGGKASYTITKTLLQQAFGFSDQEILDIIGDNPEPIPNA